MLFLLFICLVSAIWLIACYVVYGISCVCSVFCGLLVFVLLPVCFGLVVLVCLFARVFWFAPLCLFA